MPKSFTVYGHTITVDAKKHKDVDPDWCGWSDILSSTIGINSGMSSIQTKATYLHEVLHHVWSLNGLSTRVRAMSFIPAVTAVAIEEEIIRGFENGVFDLIRNNPKLMKWLMSNG